MSEQLTDQRIAELERLEKAATAGPWIQQRYGQPGNPYIIASTCIYPSPRTTVAIGKPTGGQGWPAVGDCGMDWKELKANAALIAAARNALPDLLDELKRLREENAELRAVVAKLPKTADGVTVTPGMLVWYCTPDGPQAVCWQVGQSRHEAHVCDWRGREWLLSLCYSTREGAEAAKGGGR